MSDAVKNQHHGKMPERRERINLSDDYSLQKHDCVYSAFTTPFGLSG